MARWLNSIGVAAFVLQYRLRPDYQSSVAYLDARRAIRYVRHNADAYGIDLDRIGMMGFSAEAVLASQMATRYDAGDSRASDPVEHVGSRPDFTVLVYPGLRDQDIERVTSDSPPSFLVATHADRTVSPKKALEFSEALLDNDIRAELRVFGRGAHGTGMAPGLPGLGQWPGLLAGWLRTQGFLSD